METADAASILQAVSQMQASVILPSSASDRHQEVVEVEFNSDAAPDLPCTFCRVPLTAATRQSCMLNSCLRPFCAFHASCTRSVRVIGLLLYCSMQCAKKDGQQLPRSLTLSSSQSSSGPGTVTATSKPTYTYETIAYTCNTCLLPITHDVKTWCCACLKYVHKRTKGQPWCTRKGWTRGGTMLVDTLVTCIECRFAKDQEWLDFTKGSAQVAHEAYMCAGVT